MDFHEINAIGPVWIQRVATLPAWDSLFEGRMVYALDSDLMSYADDAEWITVGNVRGPATNTDAYIPQWDGANSKILKNGLAFSTDTALGVSDSTISSQKAIKTYIDVSHAALTIVHGATGAVVGTTNSQTLTNKTLTSPVINTQVTGTAIETGDAPTDSTTIFPSSHTVKTYIDGLIAAGGGSLATHAALTIAHGATGAVVGTTNSQTLTGKTLTSPIVNTQITGTAIETGDAPTDTSTVIPSSHTVYTALATKQASIGYIPENIANKSTGISLGSSDTLYPSQKAVKTYVDTLIATKQATIGYVPENIANKSTNTSLGSSNDSYPSQNAVKTYVDAHAALTIAHGATGAVVGTTNAQTLSGKTLTSPIINTSISGDAIENDTALTSNSSTKVPTTLSVKGYADTKIAKSLYTENTILIANTAGVPITLTVGTNTLIGRVLGNITTLNRTALRQLLGITVTGAAADAEIVLQVL
jgi:hypothetical protein